MMFNIVYNIHELNEFMTKFFIFVKYVMKRKNLLWTRFMSEHNEYLGLYSIILQM